MDYAKCEGCRVCDPKFAGGIWYDVQGFELEFCPGAVWVSGHGGGEGIAKVIAHQLNDEAMRDGKELSVFFVASGTEDSAGSLARRVSGLVWPGREGLAGQAAILITRTGMDECHSATRDGTKAIGPIYEEGVARDAAMGRYSILTMGYEIDKGKKALDPEIAFRVAKAFAYSWLENWRKRPWGRSDEQGKATAGEDGGVGGNVTELMAGDEYDGSDNEEGPARRRVYFGGPGESDAFAGEVARIVSGSMRYDGLLGFRHVRPRRAGGDETTGSVQTESAADFARRLSGMVQEGARDRPEVVAILFSPEGHDLSCATIAKETSVVGPCDEFGLVREAAEVGANIIVFATEPKAGRKAAPRWIADLVEAFLNSWLETSLGQWAVDRRARMSWNEKMVKAMEGQRGGVAPGKHDASRD